MLGLLGAAIFGVICYGAWASADDTERIQRNNSKENGHEFYFDKRGKMRHTGSGRKYTPEEIHRFYNPNPIPLKERIEQIDKRNHDLFDNKYFDVYNAQNHNIIEVFLTEEEAKKYVEENYTENDYYYWKIICKVSKYEASSNKNKYHLNFDERSW